MKNYLKKIISSALCALLVGGAAVTLPEAAPGDLSFGMIVNAADSTASSGKFQYTETSEGTITITGYTGGESNVVVPAQIVGKNVTYIENWAFEKHTGLVKVTLPDTLKGIGPGAFSDCTSLTAVKIPGSVSSIGSGAFYGCKVLTSISVPISVNDIGYDAFENCSSLTGINVDSDNPSYTSINGVLFN